MSVAFSQVERDLGGAAAPCVGGVIDRIDVVVRFLAVLELFKQGAVELHQKETFGDITVVWTGGADLRAEARADETSSVEGLGGVSR